MRKSIWITASALALLACSAVTLQQMAPAAPALEKDIVFGAPGGENLMLDFIRPTQGKGPFPLLVVLHGGGWRAGSRADYQSGMPGFAQLGWAVAAVQYRLAPKYKFPAQIDDVRMALAFLRTNAQKYNIDPARIGVIGASAGGHLGLLLGLAPDGSGLPSGIRAVVSYAGPTDFRTWRATDEGEKYLHSIGGIDGMLRDFLGTADRSAPVMAVASPLSYVRKGNPAVLSLQGSVDPLCPPQQAELLHEALRKAGVAEKLVIYPGGGHGLAGEQAGQSIVEMTNFLNVHVRDAR
ncbi:MAG: alpha/beta hydrolase fold domain-containing protein [Panacagrimonas sp.]